MLAQHHDEFSLSWGQKAEMDPLVLDEQLISCSVEQSWMIAPGKCHGASIHTVIHKLHEAT